MRSAVLEPIRGCCAADVCLKVRILVLQLVLIDEGYVLAS